MVRERFLECVEAPAAEDYTKAYEISEFHSYRTSPLAVELLDHLLAEPVYLCLIGNDLPFHREVPFRRYREALGKVLDILDEQQLERAAIELLTETELSQVVAHYLVSAFSEEQPLGSLARNIPEVAAAERKLVRSVERLSAIAGVSIPTKQRYTDPVQPSLFQLQENGSGFRLTDLVAIPRRIQEIRIDGSAYAPLIFWALVALRSAGVRWASGVEITRIINEYLVDDHNRKEPTNVSRALRGKALKSQDWLAVLEGTKPRRKRFGLSENWEKSWIEIFGKPVPQFE
jgi:hypothetical protein